MIQENPINNSTDCLPVIKYGESILRTKARTVKDFTIIPEIVSSMYETMRYENGIGLAANQVGWDLNLLIIDTRNHDDENGYNQIIINAKIIHSEGEIIMEEGCLSIPNIRAEIKRPETIIIKFQNIDQKYYEQKYAGITSRAIQHEIDHLNGKLFIDYLPQAKRMLIKKRLLEISKTGNPSSGIIL